MPRHTEIGIYVSPVKNTEYGVGITDPAGSTHEIAKKG